VIPVAFGGNNTSGPIDIAARLNAKGGSGRMDFETETFLATPTHSLTAAGHDASEDGTGRGTPLVPVGFTNRGFDSGETAETLHAASHGALPMVAHTTATLTSNGDQHRGIRDAEGLAIAFTDRTRADGRNVEAQERPIDLHNLTVGGGVTSTLDGQHSQHKRASVLTPAMAVRRLTPTECLRLMNFPDDWLDGLGLSDSAKYRMCGNSIVVSVAAWIASRLA
jgi:DNA (cytosine-5)-methyltransferase 1